MGGILFSASSENHHANDHDILVYSIADALLGAAGLGGLYNYPEKDKNNNPEILRKIERDIHYRRFKIENIDVTISTPIREIENKFTEIHSQLIAWLYLKSEQLNMKFTAINDDAPEKDFKIKITSIALLNDRA